MGRHKKNKSEHLQEYSKITNDSDNEDVSSLEIDEKTREFSENTVIKRSHVNDDSDHEDEGKPKKIKKKKKPPSAEASSGKKSKISIRQMKREKYAMRLALEQASAKDQLTTQCLNYLSQWKHDKQNWKFMKARQVWLNKNKFSTQLIPDSSWPLLLEYFESAKGNIKNLLLSDANKIIKQMDEWTESQSKDGKCDNDESETTTIEKPNEIVYNRARSLIQCLQE